ncbi:ATP-dependent helicase, partial [Virgibacillus soli]
MKFKPHKYQEFATNFIIENPITAIFLEMGLGKSVITLTAIYELMLERFEVDR